MSDLGYATFSERCRSREYNKSLPARFTKIRDELGRIGQRRAKLDEPGSLLLTFPIYSLHSRVNSYSYEATVKRERGEATLLSKFTIL